MTSKKDRQTKIQIIIAVLGLIGVIAVPIINLLGKQWEITTTNILLTPKSDLAPTPKFVFNRFDDPLKLFSVSYPSNFYVDKRKITDSDITVTIIPKEFSPLSENQNWENLPLIAVAIKRADSAENIENFVNNMINNSVLNYQDTDGVNLPNLVPIINRQI